MANCNHESAANAAAGHRDDLFSALISDIKTYSGKDPLLPWLRGIKKMKESLPPQLLKEKLPRFLQKCTQMFESDRRYRNDERYLRVWLQLMDYVDDPSLLLRTMETNGIGMKRSLFYQAYSLYYEKLKKFEAAEKMYHLGVQNLAEPIDDLKKSYEQFLHRMERHKNKAQNLTQQGRKFTKKPLSCINNKENNENASRAESIPRAKFQKHCRNALAEKREVEANNILDEHSHKMKQHEETSAYKDSLSSSSVEHCGNLGRENSGIVAPTPFSKGNMTKEKSLNEPGTSCKDDTVVVRFVDTAIVGKSEAEDARHHGLVEPTVNMKEAIDAINSMFAEPIEMDPLRKGSLRSRQKDSHNGFTLFVDDNLDNHQKGGKSSLLDQCNIEAGQPQPQPLEIYVDSEENCASGYTDDNDKLEQIPVQNEMNDLVPGFVFPCPKDDSPESSNGPGAGTSSRRRFREDTVVCKFVGSAILEEPAVENVCHHGLVDPTINLKEAMEDINNMFGKPIDFVRRKRSMKKETPRETQACTGFVILPDDDEEDDGDHAEQEQCQMPQTFLSKAATEEKNEGFSILVDDDMKPPPAKVQQRPSSKLRDTDLYEPTLFTKEAMDDISKMFGMPLDF